MFSPFAFEFPKNAKPMKIWCSRFFFFLPISWLHYMEQLEQWQETEWERAGMTCRPPCGVQVWPKWRTCIVCSFYILLISGIRLVLWTSILQVPKWKKGLFVRVSNQNSFRSPMYVLFLSTTTWRPLFRRKPDSSDLREVNSESHFTVFTKMILKCNIFM